MRGLKCVVVVGVAVLGAALGTVVGIGGSSAGGQATAASLSGDPTGKLDPVLNAGTKAVLKAVDQGLALVLGGKDGKGGTSGFKGQQTTWNRVKNGFTTGESKFANTTSKASDQFLNGVLSGGDPTADLIQLLKLISGYQQKMSGAATGWDLTQQKKAAGDPGGTGMGAGKLGVSDLKGATQLIQTIVKAEIKLYENVAIAEIEYEGGLVDAKAAVAQIDAAFAAFEKAVTGGAGSLVKGAPVGWNQVVNKQVAPVVNTWDVKVNTTSLNVIAGTPQTVTTTTTTVTQPRTSVTITCPVPPNGSWWTPGDPITVTGSVSPPVAGAAVTMTYGASPTGTSTTHTDTTAANGTFTDAATAPPTNEPYAQSIQAGYGGELSNACPAEFAGG